MKYTKENLIEALKRLSPNTEIMIKGGIRLPIICERIAIDLFVDYDNWSDTDFEGPKDRQLLRRALKDLYKGQFNFVQDITKTDT